MTSLKEIKKKYEDEWVLVRVLGEDARGRPTEVELITHSKARGEIYEKQRKMNGDLAILYTGEIPKKGYAVAFNGRA